MSNLIMKERSTCEHEVYNASESGRGVHFANADVAVHHPDHDEAAQQKVQVERDNIAACSSGADSRLEKLCSKKASALRKYVADYTSAMSNDHPALQISALQEYANSRYRLPKVRDVCECDIENSKYVDYPSMDSGLCAENRCLDALADEALDDCAEESDTTSDDEEDLDYCVAATMQSEMEIVD